LQQFPLADDQIIAAGVIDDLTGFIEHPEVVADRLENVARAVGDPRRVMACTDCGFDTSAGMGRVTEDVVWAKLAAWPRAPGSPRSGFFRVGPVVSS
jgi:5-methyltetrahydropteroyltriglutamate--homocysteine methyltransferase